MRLLMIWLGSILVVGAVLGIGGVLAWVKYSEVAAAASTDPPPQQPLSVNFGDTTIVEYRASTAVIGTVLAPKSILLSNEIAGTVVKQNLNSGAEVAENDILVELDASVERAQLQAANAKLKMAQSTLVRMQGAANRAVSAVEVEEAQAASEQAAAEVLELEAIIAKKTLAAPFRARIGLSNTHKGQFLPSGSEIVLLQSIDDYVHVDFMVPQSAADSIQVNDEVTMIDESDSYRAKVVAIDSQSDRSTRNLLIRAELKPVPPQLLPGDSIRVVVEYGPTITTTAVPVEAIRHAPHNTFVFAIEQGADGSFIARERTVKVGPMIGQRFSVLSGLERGEKVVADGSFKVRKDALVSPKNIGTNSPESPAPASSPAPSTPALQETAGN